MRYFLKKDLPGIKAGTEMEKEPIPFSLSIERWKPTDGTFGYPIVADELPDWIEERDGTWKPKLGDIYYIPKINDDIKYDFYQWQNFPSDTRFLLRGLVCPTSELAIELADRMIETAKKFWEEKE